MFIGEKLALKLKKLKDPFGDPKIYSKTIKEILRVMGVRNSEIINEIASWETYAFYQRYSGCTTYGRNKVKLACKKFGIDWKEFYKRVYKIVEEFNKKI